MLILKIDPTISRTENNIETDDRLHVQNYKADSVLFVSLLD